jgi:hypothetical protein
MHLRLLLPFCYVVLEITVKSCIQNSEGATTGRDRAFGTNILGAGKSHHSPASEKSVPQKASHYSHTSFSPSLTSPKVSLGLPFPSTHWLITHQLVDSFQVLLLILQWGRMEKCYPYSLGLINILNQLVWFWNIFPCYELYYLAVY